MSTSDWANLDELNERAEDDMTTAPEADLRYLRKWLNERPNSPINCAALARVLHWEALASKQAPTEWTPEMSRAVQLYSELGAYAAANLSGAYDLFDEFWRIAIQASRPAEAQAKSEPAALTDAQLDALMPTGEAQVLWFDPRTRFGPEPQGKIIDASMAFMSSAPLGTKLFSREEVRATVRAAIAATQEQKP